MVEIFEIHSCKIVFLYIFFLENLGVIIIIFYFRHK